MKVVSLVPSVTETLVAWDLPPVACTRFCEQTGIAQVGGTKNPDVAAIVALSPDLVVMDEEENRREDYDALVSAGLDVHVTAVRSMADVDPAMEALAGRVGTSWTSAGSAGPDGAESRITTTVRAFVPIWRRPWMALGEPTYGASVLEALGVANVFALDGPYRTVSLAQAATRHPDVVVAPSEPYPFSERHVADLQAVAPQVVLVDGKDLFWWGWRTRAALDRLGEVLAGL